jgi:hypothetical protein
LVVFGIILASSCSTGVHISSDTLDRMAVAFYAISPAFNILVTGMIAYTLIRQHMRMKKVISGPFSGLYLSIVGIIAESAALYSASTLAFAIFLNRHDMIQYGWEGVMTGASVSLIHATG